MAPAQETAAPITSDDRGQTLVEYALIIALVSLAAIAALGFLSGRIQSVFSKAGNSLNAVEVSSAGGGPSTVPGGGSVSMTAHNSLADAQNNVNPDSSPDENDFLRAATSGWSPGPIVSYTYQWQRDTTLFATCGTATNWSTVQSNTTAQPVDILFAVAVSGLQDPYRVVVTATNAVGVSTTSAQACFLVDQD